MCDCSWRKLDTFLTRSEPCSAAGNCDLSKGCEVINVRQIPFTLWVNRLNLVGCQTLWAWMEDIFGHETRHPLFPSVLWHCWLGYRPDVYSSRVVTTHHLHHPLAAIKSRMETFWYWLTHRFNWKMAVKMEREREREREREDTTAEVVLQMYDAL